MMLRLLKRLFGGKDALAAPRDVQVLRRELAALTSDLERQRRGEAERVSVAVEAERERLLTDAAGSAAQLLTQAHLLEVEQQPLQARDVLSVARRLLRLLQDEGLTPQGRVGEAVAFDPALHEPLGDATLERGSPAVVRLVGLTYRGKVLRRAGVVPREG